MLPVRSLSLCAAALAPSLVSSPALAQSQTLVEPVPSQVVVGGQHAAAYRIWKLGCLGQHHEVSDAEFQQVIDVSRALAEQNAGLQPQQVPTTSQLGAFDLQLTVVSPPPGAAAAIAAVESYLEARLGSNHATGPVAISVQFAPLAPTTGMSTGTTYFALDYPTLRSNWIATMDADDVIEAFLPAASVPVRLDSASATVTNFTQLLFGAPTVAATVPNVVGLPATHAVITVNSNAAWDYDPTNGVPAGTFCFQSAFVHEVGHALGFGSAVGTTATLPLQLDAFRFQRTSGNPTSFAQFTTLARLVDDLPNDDAEVDFVNFEYAMEDSTPLQASHFREATPRIGSMDPVLNDGETYWPTFFLSSDFRVLDALGFDWEDPSQSGLAHLVSINRLDENPNSSDSVRWQVDFDERVGGVNAGQFGVAGVTGASVAGVTNVVGNAIQLSGLNWLDGFNNAAATTIGQGAFTVECSIRPTPQSTPAPTRTFLAFGSGASGQGMALTLDSQNRVVVEVSGLFYLWSSPVINDGNWHHVALTSSGGALATVTLLVDGAAAGSNIIPLNLQSGSFAIGRSLLSNPSINGFIGAIDEVRFWNGALSAGTLTANRDLALPAGGPLRGCFPLDVLADLGFDFPSLLDTPEATLAGGWAESNWAPGGAQPVLVAGRANSGSRYVLSANAGAGSGTLTPTFNDNDTVLELRSGAPLDGPGSGATNGQPYTIQHGSGFSFGFGTGCPCANDTPLGTNVGCLSSIGQGGKLRASGSPSIASANLVLQGSQMPNATAVYMFAGVAANLPQFDGILAVNNLVARRTKTNVGGGSQFPDVGDLSIAALVAPSAGQTSYFQVWYRNAATFCTSATSNYTNAWRVTWTP